MVFFQFACECTAAHSVFLLFVKDTQSLFVKKKKLCSAVQLYALRCKEVEGTNQFCKSKKVQFCLVRDVILLVSYKGAILLADSDL